MKAFLKTLSWRTIGALDTFAIALLVTGKMSAAASVMSVEIVTKSFLYYSHELAWDRFWKAS